MNRLTEFLTEELLAKRKGGLYHKTQVQLAYNSNRIEGSKLTEEQTRYIFETRTIGFKDQEAVPVDDIIETTNHFVAFDDLLRTISEPLSEDLIKGFHRRLKTGTSDAQLSYFNVGDYKKLANEVGGFLKQGESFFQIHRFFLGHLYFLLIPVFPFFGNLCFQGAVFQGNG